MALHRLASITMGVPNVADTIDYYTEFGLTPTTDGWLSSRDGGEQLRVVRSPTRRLLEVVIGADDDDDIDRIDHELHAKGFLAQRHGDAIIAHESVADVRATVRVSPRLVQEPAEPTPYNGPGRIERYGRAPGVLRDDPIRPRKLGHAVIGSTDYAQTCRFFVDGLGFKVSDHSKGHGSFMRCSTDHHNVLVMQSPVTYLHHTSWQVDDIDDVGRGATAMLEGNPERHVWGLGPPRRLELLLVSQGSGGQLLRVLLRHGLHPRRRHVDPGGSGRGTRTVQLGTSATTEFPRSRGPGRHDDRGSRRTLSHRSPSDVPRWFSAAPPNDNHLSLDGRLRRDPDPGGRF
jgi:catechol 2,3-dioxygenase-like lactoylglutathione lyase family enzyme